MQIIQRENFLDVVKTEIKLCQVGQRAQGGTGNLLEVIVIEIKNAEMIQTQESVLGDCLDPVLAKIQLLDGS